MHRNDTATTRQRQGKHTATTRKKQRRHGKATSKTLHKHTRPRPRHGKNRARHDKDMAKTWQKQEQRHSKIRATMRQSLRKDTAKQARPRPRHGKSRTRQEKTRQRHGTDTAKTPQKTPHQRYSATPEIRMQTSEQPKNVNQRALCKRPCIHTDSTALQIAVRSCELRRSSAGSRQQH